jgi:hypothetical protein
LTWRPPSREPSFLLRNHTTAQRERATHVPRTRCRRGGAGVGGQLAAGAL